jgi:hypothetical protein
MGTARFGHGREALDVYGIREGSGDGALEGSNLMTTHGG